MFCNNDPPPEESDILVETFVKIDARVDDFFRKAQLLNWLFVLLTDKVLRGNSFGESGTSSDIIVGYCDAC